MMRVRFDDLILRAQRHGGISRYLTELVGEFERQPKLGVRPIRGKWVTSNVHALEAGLGWQLPGVDRVHPRARRALYELSSRILMPRVRSDLTHATFYRPGGPQREGDGPLVVTVYDMAPERFPGMFPVSPHKGKHEYVERADLVICISETTRSELQSIWGPVGARVEVVHLGVRQPRFVAQDVTRKREVLYVGARSKYKDFDVLARAFAKRKRAWNGLQLAGGGPLTGDERRLLGRLGISGQVSHCEPSDDQLQVLYSTASAFVFPSRYEGFGVPTLEAMASGCPVILSRSGSHVEVGGDAAMYFEPGDENDLVDRLDQLADDPALADALSERGRERSRSFTWTKTAEETAKLYSSLL